MAPSWLPLFTSILEAHVGRPALSIILPFDESDSNLQIYQTASYLAAGSWCKILAMDKLPSSYVEDQEHNSSLHDARMIEAALVNLPGNTTHSATFVVPSETPELSLSSYHSVWSTDEACYYVCKRDITVLQPGACTFPMEAICRTQKRQHIPKDENPLPPCRFTSSISSSNWASRCGPSTDDYSSIYESLCSASSEEDEPESPITPISPPPCSPSGLKAVPKFEMADRSVDWFWSFPNKHGSLPYDPRHLSSHQAVATAKAEEAEVHHYNFSHYPVHQKSSTPPAVSLWVTFSDSVRHHYPDKSGSFNRESILASQAAKFVDPFSYHGPSDVLELRGSALRNAVVGMVKKCYWPDGSWIGDDYKDGDDIPANAAEAISWFKSGEELSELPQPYFISEVVDGDLKLNDDTGTYPILPAKRPALHRERLSRLCFVENISEPEIHAPVIDNNSALAIVPVTPDSSILANPMDATPALSLSITENTTSRSGSQISNSTASRRESQFKAQAAGISERPGDLAESIDISTSSIIGNNTNLEGHEPTGLTSHLSLGSLGDSAIACLDLPDIASNTNTASIPEADNIVGSCLLYGSIAFYLGSMAFSALRKYT